MYRRSDSLTHLPNRYYCKSVRFFLPAFFLALAMLGCNFPKLRTPRKALRASEQIQRASQQPSSPTHFNPSRWDEKVLRLAPFELNTPEEDVDIHGIEHISFPEREHTSAIWARDIETRMSYGTSYPQDQPEKSRNWYNLARNLLYLARMPNNLAILTQLR